MKVQFSTHLSAVCIPPHPHMDFIGFANGLKASAKTRTMLGNLPRGVDKHTRQWKGMQ